MLGPIEVWSGTTRLGVTGWVRNTAGGSVELEVQGDASAVDALLRWAETGPVGARVARVAVVPRPVEEGEVVIGAGPPSSALR